MSKEKNNQSRMSVGVDLESVASFRSKSLDQDRRFFERLFSQEEIDYCQKMADPAPHYTARFCAKEAFVKAARAYEKVFVSDSEVRKTESGAPKLHCRGDRDAAQRIFENFDIFLSLSHTKEIATAFVVLREKELS